MYIYCLSIYKFVSRRYRHELKKILKDAPDLEGGSRKKSKRMLLNRDFVYYYGDFYFY